MRKHFYSEDEIDFIVSNYGKIPYKEMSLKLGKPIHSITTEAHRYVENLSGHGKSNFCRRIEREFHLNDHYFSILNTKNSYWAGFIAADGGITKNRRKLIINLSDKDRGHLLKFKEDIEFCGPMMDIPVGKYKSVRISLTSQILVSDLKINFNIVPQKSLILEPPILSDDRFIDSFIIGYIDGDGSIGLTNGNLQIQIAGTKQLLEWIQKRFSDILGLKICSIYKSGNIFILNITHRRARKIFMHYYFVDVPKLTRKWNGKILEYCLEKTVKL